MDDWSLLPSRNAVSEPAPYHQSPLNQHSTPLPDSTRRVKRPPPAPRTPPRWQRLTRQTEPGNAAMKPRGRAPKPFTYRTITTMNTPTKQPNGTNLQPPLDTNVPFMDDIGVFVGCPMSVPKCRIAPLTTAACRATGRRSRGHATHWRPLGRGAQSPVYGPASIAAARADQSRSSVDIVPNDESKRTGMTAAPGRRPRTRADTEAPSPDAPGEESSGGSTVTATRSRGTTWSASAEINASSCSEWPTTSTRLARRSAALNCCQIVLMIGSVA